MAKDLQAVIDSWTQSAATAQPKYVAGIENTTKDPIAAAIRSEAALLSNFQASVTSGRWRQGLSRVGKAGWQQASVAKANNYATGIQAGQAKYASAMQTWLPRINQAAAQANAMPSGSLAANLARANAFATALYNAKRAGA